MNAKFERHATEEVRGVIENAAAMNSIAGAAIYLQSHLRGWFIYHGGCHVAVHLRSGGPRYAIITDR